MRKFLAAAAMIAAVIGPAYSQGKKGPGPNTELGNQDEAAKRRNKDIDKAYNDTLKHTGTAAKPYDPWQTVRSPPPPAAKN
jgi:hypothetical protein